MILVPLSLTFSDVGLLHNSRNHLNLYLRIFQLFFIVKIFLMQTLNKKKKKLKQSPKNWRNTQSVSDKQKKYIKMIYTV